MRAVPLAAIMLAFSPFELSAQKVALNAHATVTSEIGVVRLSDLALGTPILPGTAAAAPTIFGTPCADGFSPPVGGNVGGTHYIYVSGVVSSASSASAPAGSYAGTFSVTATYVNY